MNQRAWKPADHRLGVERIGTVFTAVAGGLMLAGAMFFVLLLLVHGAVS